jgi:hypothetical protein
MRNIDFSSDAHCAAANPDPVSDPTVVVREGRLANAVVWVSKGAERWSFAPTEEPVELAIERCMLSPHAVTLRTGQPLRLVNRGSCSHGIHAIPSRGSRNPESNRTVTRGAPPLFLRFPFPETGMKLKCDVHPWIGAWAAVFEHPFHAVTDDRGEAFLRLPPGEFEVSVWHEFDRFARPESRTVRVEEGGTADLEFVFTTK